MDLDKTLVYLSASAGAEYVLKLDFYVTTGSWSALSDSAETTEEKNKSMVRLQGHFSALLQSDFT